MMSNLNANQSLGNHTRQSAFEAGLLVDVSEFASEVGFRCEVALTTELWLQCVIVDTSPAALHAFTVGVKNGAAVGRLYDLLYLGYDCILKSDDPVQRLDYPLYVTGVPASTMFKTQVSLMIGRLSNRKLFVTFATPQQADDLQGLETPVLLPINDGDIKNASEA